MFWGQSECVRSVKSEHTHLLPTQHNHLWGSGCLSGPLKAGVCSDRMSLQVPDAWPEIWWQAGRQGGPVERARRRKGGLVKIRHRAATLTGNPVFP